MKNNLFIGSIVLAVMVLPGLQAKAQSASYYDFNGSSTQANGAEFINDTREGNNGSHSNRSYRYEWCLLFLSSQRIHSGKRLLADFFV